VALARYLRQEGVVVVEVNRADRAARRRRGKTDPVDAKAAARAVLAIRCIKRYLAREIYRLLQPLTPEVGTTPRAG
jgi:transposase